MSLLQKYEKNSEYLSNVEHVCFKKLLELDVTDKNITIQYLADYFNVSTTTIFRMTKKLGYTSFNEFRYDLLYHRRQEFDQKGMQEDVLQHIKQQVEETFSLLQDTNINSILDTLLKAKTVLICSSGMNNYIAKILSIKLSLVGVKTVFPDDQWFMFLEATNLQKEDVVIILSKEGKTKELLDVAKSAKINGAKVILIGEPGSSPISQLANHKISVAVVENEGYDIDSRLQMHIAINYIAKQMVERKYQEHVQSR